MRENFARDGQQGDSSVVMTVMSAAFPFVKWEYYTLSPVLWNVTGPAVLRTKILFIYIFWSKSLPINTATLSYSTSHIPHTNCAYVRF